MRSYRFPQRHCQETGVNSRLFFQFAVVLLSVALPVGGQRLTSLHSVLKQGAIVDTSQNQEEGPRLVSSEIATSAMLLRFTHTDGGLVLHTSTPSAFMIAGADHKWFRAGRTYRQRHHCCFDLSGPVSSSGALRLAIQSKRDSVQ